MPDWGAQTVTMFQVTQSWPGAKCHRIPTGSNYGLQRKEMKTLLHNALLCGPCKHHGIALACFAFWNSVCFTLKFRTEETFFSNKNYGRVYLLHFWISISFTVWRHFSQINFTGNKEKKKKGKKNWGKWIVKWFQHLMKLAFHTADLSHH